VYISHYRIWNGRREAHSWGANRGIWALRLIESTGAGERPRIEYAPYLEDGFSATATEAIGAGTPERDWPPDDDFTEVPSGSGREEDLERLWQELLVAFLRESNPADAFHAWATANALPT
jgi:hypothetical protein